VCDYSKQKNVYYGKSERITQREMIMIAISTTELRRNIKKYLTMVNHERVVVQSGKAEAYEIIPAKKISDTDKYFSNPKVLEAIERGRENIKAGRFITITDPKKIWDTILS
jgi:PHD/YefM family antitoxin component YafN of YafNO toxin-antitoxin module